MSPRRKKLETIGDRIRSLRLKQKFTQEELSRNANVTLVSLAKIEQGSTKNPGIAIIAKIAFALGLGLDSFLEGLDLDVVTKTIPKPKKVGK